MILSSISCAVGLRVTWCQLSGVERRVIAFRGLVEVRSAGPSRLKFALRDILAVYQSFVSRDARTVRIGNRISDRSCLLLNEAHARSIPAFEENPAYSYSWSQRSRRQQLNRPNVRDYVIDHCSFGSRFRKRTRIRCFHARDHRLLKATCTSSRGCCSYTGQPHVILSGVKDRDSVTKAREVYGDGFCKFFGRFINKSIVARRCADLHAVLSA